MGTSNPANPAALHYELLRDFTALGKELGLKDAELNKFVSEQVKVAHERANAERDERKLAREAEQQARTAEKEAREAELRRLDLQREIDKQARDDELRRFDYQRIAEEEARQKAHDREMEKLRLQQEIAHGTSTSSQHHSDDEDAEHSEAARGKRGPRMPFFDDTKDDIDAYLYRFERIAELAAYQRGDYALYLSALLRGKALECYNRLGLADARNYDKLKAALLRKFGKTEDGYRKQFFSCKRESAETANQFIVRLKGYFDRWLELAKVNDSFEALQTFIVQDRFLDSCEEKLALYLRERKFPSLDEMITAADYYLDAHKNPSDLNTLKDKSKFFRKPDQNKEQVNSDDSSDKGNKLASASHTREPSKRNVDDRVCYNCGQAGHISRNCPFRRKNKTDNSAAACIVVPDQESVGAVQLSNDDLHVVGGLTVAGVLPRLADKLFTADGFVDGVSVKCMRDNGSTVGVIRASLVKSEQLTGRRQKYVMIDGTMRENDVAIVPLDCPFFKGPFECIVVNSPLCDIVVGNVVGAVRCEPCEVGAAVVTRLMASKEGKPPKPFLVPQVDVLQDNVENLSRM